MVPLRLILKGSKGLKAGIGVDEIDLDLSSLPEGLIAISGPNGAGKTTLLDSLTAYRLQPYKVRQSGDWSTNSFTYYDHFQGSDARKELWWSMSGRNFKSLILIDSDRRKQECYLHELVGGQWVPFPGCSGKTKEYDAAVESILGSTTMFFSSVFRCQSARNLSDYRRSEIMQIISELLNIDHIKQQADKCRVVVNGLSAGLASVRSRLADIDKEQETITDLQHRISERDADIARDHLLRDDARGKLEATRSLVQSLKEKKAAQVSELGRLELLKSQLADEQGRLRSAETVWRKSVADLTAKMDSLKAAHARFRSDLDTKVARAEKIVLGCEAIRLAVVNEVEFVAHVEQLKKSLATATAERDQHRSVVSAVEKELAGLLAEIKSVEASVAKLDGLDCHGDGTGWLNPHCRFIADAVAGKDVLPGLLTRRDVLYGSKDVAEKAFAAAADLVADTTKALAAAEQSLQECLKFTRLLPELEQAEANLAEWRNALVVREKEVESDYKTLDGEKWYADSGWDLERIKLTDAIAALQTQIADFPTGEDIDLMLRGAAVTEAAELSAMNGYDTRIREAELEVSGLKAKLDVSRTRLGEGDELRRQAARYESEIAKFSMLMKACSNDGIVALELDDAAPSIAAIVNDLLRECYGSRFSVRLETQAQKVDGDMKETFDIRIFDADTGNDRSITECSGGQTNWLEDAITRGICLFNIHRSDRVFGTLYSDERDGMLDAARKREFMAVKRKSLEIGTHEREFFISQSPDLIDMADARIVLAPGGVSVC